MRLSTLLAYLGQLSVVSAAGFSPAGPAFGLPGRLQLPLSNRNRRGGRLAETMSEALDELRETRVELAALREEMQSIREMERSARSFDVAGSSDELEDDSPTDIEASAPVTQKTSPARRTYALGLTSA